MTFDDFEVYVRREIENYLNPPSSGTLSHYINFDTTHYLVLKWRTISNKSDVRFAINYDSEEMFMEYSLDVECDFGEDDYHSHGRVAEVPTSEEDYFQKSTVHDLGFRWEFYEYLYSVFEQLRNK